MLTNTTTIVILSALCLAPLLTACDEPEYEDEVREDEDEDEARLVGIEAALELVAPEAEPVGIYNDDAPGPGPVESFPDLVINTAGVFRILSDGDYWYAQFSVKNIGNAKAPASKGSVLLLDEWNNPDPNGSHAASVPELAPGAIAPLTIKFATLYDVVAGYARLGGQSWTIQDHKLRYVADTTNVVSESKETNNSYVIAW